jgi:hypothetical protein
VKAPPQPLAVATLEEMSTAPTNPQPVGDPIGVQFNPTTLRLAMQNSVDMKKAFGKRPATQYDGTSSSVLTFDLVFDCADEGTTESPVDVRTRVAPIEKFLLPAAGQKKSIPPRVRFTYGSLQLIGVMTALNAEYDLFSDRGIPLRAKLGVTIKEQLPEYEQGAVGSGANDGAGAQDPAGLLPPGAGPGAAPTQTGTAVAGESAPDFAARMGLDPSAWKGLDLGGLDPLSLAAGASIDFSVGLTVDLGTTAGVSIGASADAPVFSGPNPPAPSAVTAAGGLQKALDHDAARAVVDAAASARSAFAGPAAPAAPAAAPAALPSVPNPRSLTFGFGVPLRGSVAAPDPYARLPRWGERAAAGDVPTTADPSVPGWVALRPEAIGAAGSGSPSCGGSCGGRCGSGPGRGSPGAPGLRATRRAARPAAPTPRVVARPAVGTGCTGCRGCR